MLSIPMDLSCFERSTDDVGKVGEDAVGDVVAVGVVGGVLVGVVPVGVVGVVVVGVVPVGVVGGTVEVVVGGVAGVVGDAGAVGSSRSGRSGRSIMPGPPSHCIRLATICIERSCVREFTVAQQFAACSLSRTEGVMAPLKRARH